MLFVLCALALTLSASTPTSNSPDSIAAAPAGFYPRSKADGLLEVGTWVWSNSGDISCAWEGDLPAADKRCWQGNQETLFDYQRARIVEIIEDRPGDPLYRIMYEPFHPGMDGMPQWVASVDEVFEGYNLPPEVREFSNLLVRTNW